MTTATTNNSRLTAEMETPAGKQKFWLYWIDDPKNGQLKIWTLGRTPQNKLIAIRPITFYATQDAWLEGLVLNGRWNMWLVDYAVGVYLKQINKRLHLAQFYAGKN
jgi:hypothetical protein